MMIAIDLDDVLADSLTAFIEFYNSNHKEKIKYEDFMAYTLNEIKGTPREEENRLLKEFDASKYFENIRPMPKAQETIKELSKKYKLIIVTSRTTNKEQKTRNWIEKHFPEIKDILFTRQDYKTSQKTKAEICKEIQAEFLIEDNLKYAEQVAEAGIKVLLFDYPWNQTAENKLITRVKGWDEIVEILK